MLLIRRAFAILVQLLWCFRRKKQCNSFIRVFWSFYISFVVDRRLFRGNIVIVLYLILFKKQNASAWASTNVWAIHASFKRCMWGCSATKRRLPWWCLKDFGALYTVVRHVYHDRHWFGSDNRFFFFFFFSLFSLNFALVLAKFQNNPFNYFFLHIFSLCFWLLFFFYFRISYKIINDLQIQHLLFFNL